MSDLDVTARPPQPGRLPFSKVPEITVWFWIVKILTTGLGEAASDAMVRHLGPVIVVVVAVAFGAALAVQLRADRYVAWRYWSTVGLVAVFGTMAADVPRALGVPLWVTSAVYLAGVAAVFGVWHRIEGALCFATITTRRREVCYWAAVVATFALGTAVGDLTAETWGLGNLISGLLFCALFALPFLARRRFGLGTVPAFWIAYVLTRPLGASFADWMGFPAAHGGLGIATGTVAVAWALAIVLVVTVLASTRNPALSTGKQSPQPS